MTPLVMIAILLVVSVAAGFFGSLLGLGGATMLTPILTLLLGIDIRVAIGAGVVSVIATSSGAAAAYVRDGLSNLRVAMFLEIGTVAGALTGAYVAGWLPVRALYLIFAVILGYSALMMLRSRTAHDTDVPPSALADRLELHGSYRDGDGVLHHYRTAHPLLGLGFMYVAGCVSGLLGIGSGALKVPALDLTMRLPIKVSSATSNLMMGVTAAASAAVFLARGQIQPLVAGPVAIGVLIGATIGARVLPRVDARLLRRVFVVVLLVVVAQMLWKGLQ